MRERKGNQTDLRKTTNYGREKWIIRQIREKTTNYGREERKIRQIREKKD